MEVVEVVVVVVMLVGETVTKDVTVVEFGGSNGKVPVTVNSIGDVGGDGIAVGTGDWIGDGVRGGIGGHGLPPHPGGRPSGRIPMSDIQVSFSGRPSISLSSQPVETEMEL